FLFPVLESPSRVAIIFSEAQPTITDFRRYANQETLNTKRDCQKLVAMCLLPTIQRPNRERRRMPATSANPLSPKTTLKIGITTDPSSVLRPLKNRSEEHTSELQSRF